MQNKPFLALSVKVCHSADNAASLTHTFNITWVNLLIINTFQLNPIRTSVFLWLYNCAISYSRKISIKMFFIHLKIFRSETKITKSMTIIFFDQNIFWLLEDILFEDKDYQLNNNSFQILWRIVFNWYIHTLYIQTCTYSRVGMLFITHFTN